MIPAPYNFAYDTKFNSREMTKANIDPKDFTIEQLKDELVVRKPGTINGQQFIVQDCQVGMV